MIKIMYGPNEKNIREVEVTPPKRDSLVAFVLAFLEKGKPTLKKKPATLRPGLCADVRPAHIKNLPATPSARPKVKQVWRVKKVQPSTSTSPGQDAAPSS